MCGGLRFLFDVIANSNFFFSTDSACCRTQRKRRSHPKECRLPNLHLASPCPRALSSIRRCPFGFGRRSYSHIPFCGSPDHVCNQGQNGSKGQIVVGGLGRLLCHIRKHYQVFYFRQGCIPGGYHPRHSDSVDCAALVYAISTRGCRLPSDGHFL